MGDDIWTFDWTKSVPILKCDQTQDLLKEAIVLDMADLRNQARKIIEVAQAEAQTIISGAQAEARLLAQRATDAAFEKGKAEGLDRGLAEGRELGRSAAREQVTPVFEQIQESFQRAAVELDKQRLSLQRDACDAILELAVRFSRKVVHRTVEVDRYVAVEQVKAALAHVLRPLDVTIRICSEDRLVLEEVMPQFVTKFPHLQHVQLVEDPDIERGGCVVSHGQGLIDASLSTQLRRAVQLMIPDRPLDAGSDEESIAT